MGMTGCSGSSSTFTGLLDRLLFRHLLDQLPYETFERPSVELPGRDESDAYDDVASMSGRRYVPEHY